MKWMNEIKTEKWWLGASILPLLVFVYLRWQGFDGLYGQDSYEYLRYTERMKAFFLGGAYPGDLVWPKGYLLLCAALSFVPAVLSRCGPWNGISGSDHYRSQGFPNGHRRRQVNVADIQRWA